MKIGDKVRIINFNKNLQKERFVCPEMTKYCGKIAEVVDIYVDNKYYTYYLLDIDKQAFVWNKELLEPAPENMVFEIPNGYTLDKVENNQIFVKKEEKSLPKTWKECIESLKSASYIDDYSNVRTADIICDDITESDRNLIPEGLGKPMLALMQLLVCREVYRQGWKPDWNKNSIKYSIMNKGNEIVTFNLNNSCILSFQSAKIRDKFLKNFRDLIEEAKELI